MLHPGEYLPGPSILPFHGSDLYPFQALVLAVLHLHVLPCQLLASVFQYAGSIHIRRHSGEKRGKQRVPPILPSYRNCSWSGLLLLLSLFRFCLHSGAGSVRSPLCCNAPLCRALSFCCGICVRNNPHEGSCAGAGLFPDRFLRPVPC